MIDYEIILKNLPFAYVIGKDAYKFIVNQNKSKNIYFHDSVKELANENEAYRVLVESAAKEVMQNNQDSIEVWDIFSSPSKELYKISKNKYNVYNNQIIIQAKTDLKAQQRKNRISKLQFSQRWELLKILSPLLYMYGEVKKLSGDKFNYSSECLDHIIFSETDNINRTLRKKFEKSLIAYSSFDSSETINTLGYLTEYIVNSQSTNLNKLISELLSNHHENQAENHKKVKIIQKGMEILDLSKRDADLATIEQYINHEEPIKGPKLIQSFMKYRDFMCINLYLSSLTILAFKEKSFQEDEFVGKIHSLDDEYGQQLNFQNI